MTCVETKRYLSSNAYPFQASQESPSIMSLEAKLDDRYANHTKEMKRLEHLEKLRKERESRVIAMPELHENHLVVCVNHPKAGMLKRIFRSTDLFQNIYDWVGSLDHLPEYFELSKVPGEIIFPSESVSKAEKCVLYMQERNDPLSLHENDSEIEFTDQAPNWEQLYEEIEASRAKKFYSLNATKRTKLLNRQDVFSKLMYLCGKDRNLLSYQIEVLLEDESGVGDGVAREVYFIFIERLLQVAYKGREEFSPIILAEFGEEEYDIVGKILYHFFVNFGLFPVQFCEVSLQNAFIGQYSENALIGSFLRFISRSDSLVLYDVLM